MHCKEGKDPVYSALYSAQCSERIEKGKIRLAEKMANLTFSVIPNVINLKLLIGKTLEERGAAEGIERSSCGGVDKGGKETIAKSRE